MEEWLKADETAQAMLERSMAQQQRWRPLMSVPLLHHVPLRAGHVLEVVGPSGSAKSELLLQATVICILPKECDGIFYGGSQAVVLMLDLDCRFDMLRLVQVLQQHINEARGLENIIAKTDQRSNTTHRLLQDKVFLDSLNRLIYTRCYNSSDFLAALKTVHAQIKRIGDSEKNALLLMIDSIGAFYWLDRSVKLTSGIERTILGLQAVCEAVVQELRNLMKIHPLLIIATKTLISASMSHDKTCIEKLENSEVQKFQGSIGPKYLSSKKILHQDFMPAAWQAFVTHRIMLRGPFKESIERSNESSDMPPFFMAQWEEPFQQVDKFLIENSGIKLVR